MSEAEKQVASAAEKKAGGLPPIVKVLIAVFVVLVVLGSIISFVIGKVVKKAGTSILNKAIEQKSGIKTSIEDLEKGKMTFTDPKTGAQVQINSGEIPSDFPKNFPLYPGAKLAATMSGNNENDEGGFWLTFTTNDSVTKVVDYFKSNLAFKGWTSTAVLEAEGTTTLAVSDNSLEGTVMATRTPNSNETTIVVILQEK